MVYFKFVQAEWCHKKPWIRSLGPVAKPVKSRLRCTGFSKGYNTGFGGAPAFYIEAFLGKASFLNAAFPGARKVTVL